MNTVKLNIKTITAGYVHPEYGTLVSAEVVPQYMKYHKCNDPACARFTDYCYAGFGEIMTSCTIKREYEQREGAILHTRFTEQILVTTGKADEKVINESYEG